MLFWVFSKQLKIIFDHQIAHTQASHTRKLFPHKQNRANRILNGIDNQQQKRTALRTLANLMLCYIFFCLFFLYFCCNSIWFVSFWQQFYYIFLFIYFFYFFKLFLKFHNFYFLCKTYFKLDLFPLTKHSLSI